jgi:hypothetical protein
MIIPCSGLCSGAHILPSFIGFVKLKLPLSTKNTNFITCFICLRVVSLEKPMKKLLTLLLFCVKVQKSLLHLLLLFEGDFLEE